eukprot:m.43918 g.43918  ORF g.43918 m.43918 type:complete len:470 (+) comp10022_c0_seq3:243-1652(+)
MNSEDTPVEQTWNNHHKEDKNVREATRSLNSANQSHHGEEEEEKELVQINEKQQHNVHSTKDNTSAVQPSRSVTPNTYGGETPAATGVDVAAVASYNGSPINYPMTTPNSSRKRFYVVEPDSVQKQKHHLLQQPRPIKKSRLTPGKTPGKTSEGKRTRLHHGCAGWERDARVAEILSKHNGCVHPEIFLQELNQVGFKLKRSSLYAYMSRWQRISVNADGGLQTPIVFPDVKNKWAHDSALGVVNEHHKAAFKVAISQALGFGTSDGTVLSNPDFETCMLTLSRYMERIGMIGPSIVHNYLSWGKGVEILRCALQECHIVDGSKLSIDKNCQIDYQNNPMNTSAIYSNTSNIKGLQPKVTRPSPATPYTTASTSLSFITPPPTMTPMKERFGSTAESRPKKPRMMTRKKSLVQLQREIQDTIGIDRRLNVTDTLGKAVSILGSVNVSGRTLMDKLESIAAEINISLEFE